MKTKYFVKGVRDDDSDRSQWIEKPTFPSAMSCAQRFADKYGRPYLVLRELPIPGYAGRTKTSRVRLVRPADDRRR